MRSGEPLLLRLQLVQRMLDQRGELTHTRLLAEVPGRHHPQPLQLAPLRTQIHRDTALQVQGTREAGVDHHQHMLRGTAQRRADDLHRLQRGPRQPLRLGARECQVVAPGRLPAQAVPGHVDHHGLMVWRGGEVDLVQECPQLLHGLQHLGADAGVLAVRPQARVGQPALDDLDLVGDALREAVHAVRVVVHGDHDQPPGQGQRFDHGVPPPPGLTNPRTLTGGTGTHGPVRPCGRGRIPSSAARGADGAAARAR